MKTYRLASMCLAILAVTSIAAADVITVGSGSQFTWDGANGPASSSGVVPENIALSSNGATAFAIDVLGGGAYAAHQISHLNDGTYGNANSWIGQTSRVIDLGGTWGSTTQGFAGIEFQGSSSISSFAFSRDNLSQECNDRDNGTYYVQVTTVLQPDASTADSAWTTIGSIANSGEGTWDGALRHKFNLNSPVTATGLRIVVPFTGDQTFGGATAIDEIEVHGVPEPSTFLLAVTSLIGLLAYVWRRRK